MSEPSSATAASTSATWPSPSRPQAKPPSWSSPSTHRCPPTSSTSCARPPASSGSTQCRRAEPTPRADRLTKRLQCSAPGRFVRVSARSPQDWRRWKRDLRCQQPALGLATHVPGTLRDVGVREAPERVSRITDAVLAVAVVLRLLPGLAVGLEAIGLDDEELR